MYFTLLPSDNGKIVQVKANSLKNEAVSNNVSLNVSCMLKFNIYISTVYCRTSRTQYEYMHLGILVLHSILVNFLYLPKCH